MKNLLLPIEIEEYRDQRWCREENLRVESVIDAENFIDQVGFAACLTDSRQPGPSLYIAVCGRRDAVMPRNVQKDPESSHTWVLKDELIRRGKIYYGKLARGKTMFISQRMVPYFHSIWGVTRREEKSRLSKEAQQILKALRREWEMGTSDLRQESGLNDRKAFATALDELQAAMIVIPKEVVYQPKFSYIWTLAEGRFGELIAKRAKKEIALEEIANCFLANAGLTLPGELAKVSGLSRAEAGLGNQVLVKKHLALRLSVGKYLYSSLHLLDFPLNDG